MVNYKNVLIKCTLIVFGTKIDKVTTCTITVRLIQGLHNNEVIKDKP